MSWQVHRYHDISCGHRVVGHEGKCRFLHGHNYRVHFTCESENLDAIGRVIDFSSVKQKLCMWLEDTWDHKFLAWEDDDLLNDLTPIVEEGEKPVGVALMMQESVVWVPFNPTAENIAKYLVEVIGPQQLKGTGVKLVSVVIEETRKCSAGYNVKQQDSNFGDR